MVLSFTTLWLLLLSLVFQPINSSAPVVGILSQPHYTPDAIYYYIAASYPKWLESGGARSIPIDYQSTNTTYLDTILDSISGILFPGGASEGVPFAAVYLLSEAERRRLPVWGTCLGFEYIVTYYGSPLRSDFVASNVSWPLANVSRSSVLYPDDQHETLQTTPIAFHSHHKGLRPEDISDELASIVRITSTNVDSNGQPFVGTIESRDPDGWPIFGVQYHPEKNMFEYATYPNTNRPYLNINHADVALTFSYSLARFFVGKLLSSSTAQFFEPVHSYPSISMLPFEQVYIIGQDALGGRSVV